MSEIGIPYLIIPPGNPPVSEYCWFNDPAPPNGVFIGRLSEDNGITGLDSPEVRESAENRAGLPGGRHGAFFEGRRPVVMEGTFDNEVTIQQLMALDMKLAKAVNALRADCYLQWTNTGSPVSPYGGEVLTKQLALRRNGRYVVSQRRPKKFAIPLVCEKHIIESLKEEVRDTGGLVQSYRNLGNTVAHPVLEIYNTSGVGIIGDFNITNSVDGSMLMRIGNGYTLPTGQKLVIDTYDWSVVERATGASSGGTNRRRYLVRSATTGLNLPPYDEVGDESITSNKGSKLVVRYRHAWTSS